MTYSIKEVAAKTHLSAYTLRFYDKAGLLPFVSRNAAGYREFTEGDLALLHTITCLKNTGMAIKDIRQYIAAVMAGPSTVQTRRALLEAHRDTVLKKQALIAQNLKEIDYKLAIYSAPDAVAKVQQEVAAASGEKQALGLADPFNAQ